ncbi:MAG TPA: response regulator [Desulfobulbus sp.]|nr:response regulator [Desulfobulbus sp.]
MTDKILFVDDEQNVLQSMRRQLRKRFPLQTALSGDEALAILKREGPFAVIVSDMRMPGMNGVELLARVKNLYPDTVRIMLTGNADQETAIEAVNSGQIFRFLTKPCSTAILVPALALAQRQYRLVTAERELLQETLKGCVTVLSELLGQAKPTVFSAGLRIRELASRLATAMDMPNIWQIEVAALLVQIGCISLPTDIINKKYAGLELDSEEEKMWAGYPETGARLLESIPRLENVTKMIRWQQVRFDELEETAGSEFDEVLTGVQILKVAIDFDLETYKGNSPRTSIDRLRRRKGMYNPLVLDALASIRFEEQRRTACLTVDDIAVGMIADEDITARNGALILPRGQEITWSVLQGLYNFNRQVGIVEPIRVRIGQEEEEEPQGA